jgi:hypothetical protein
MPKEYNVDNIISEYNIDVNSTKLTKIQGIQATTRIFRVEKHDLIDELFIVDTPYGKDIACHPHLVGSSLRKLAFKVALETSKVMNQLTDIKEIDRDSIVFENVLRAAPGYELHNAFRKLNSNKGYRDVWIYPCYVKSSYRNHDNAHVDLAIKYEDFTALPSNREITVLKPDTEATGRTGSKAIERIIRKSNEVGSTIKEVILYGFISIPAIKFIEEIVKKFGIKLVAFSIGNITELANNGYDMPLYGIDESCWRVHRDIKKLGSIVDIYTLKNYIKEFVPGLDQPGDWSNRQTSLYISKDKKEKGRIKEHINKSINLIESLMLISDNKPWQQRIAKEELTSLYSCLRN